MRRPDLRVRTRFERHVLLAGVALLVVLTLMNFIARHHVTVVVPLLLAPVLGAAALSWEATLFLGAGAIACSFIAVFPAGIFGHAQEALSQGTILVASVSLAFGAWQRERTAARMGRAVQVASKTQEALFPTVREQLGGVIVATRYQSATDETLLGGDFYEVVHSPHGGRLIVGDVVGRGIEAIGLATAVRRAFIESAASVPDLRTVAEGLDGVVAGHAGTHGEEFVTALVLGLPAEDPTTIEVVNCGHHEPISLRARQWRPFTPSQRGLPLGLGGERAADRFPFLVGDRVLCFTDGIVEARDDDGVYFPLGEAFTTVADGESLDDSLGELLDAMNRHTGGPVEDDIALVALERSLP